MTVEIQVGELVKLIGLPDWLLHDLPESEQTELRKFIGHSATVTEIDGHGYFWLGLGTAAEHAGIARYCGHSFCVSREFIESTQVDATT